MKYIRSGKPGYPEVRITEAAMQGVGDINVDLNLLNGLLRTDLGLKSEVTPKYLLYGKRPSLVKGLQVGFSSQVNIHIPSSMRHNEFSDDSPQQSIARVLIHESSHLVDSLDHKAKLAGEIALSGLIDGGITGVGVYGYERLTTFPLPVIAMLGAVIFTSVHMLYYEHDPREVRARNCHENEELVSKYQDMVTLQSPHN